MTTELSIVFAAIFLAAIPINLYVAREFNGYAAIRPQIASLVLLSRLVTVLAYAATILGAVSFTSVVFLTTGVRLVPSPITIGFFVSALLAVTGANLLAFRYLRRMRGD